MKVLLAFHSDTGNTKQLVDAVRDELATDHDVARLAIDDIDPSDLDDVDLLFVGTPIHAGGLAAPTAQFLQRLPAAVDVAVAGLVTHASSAFTRENYDRGLDALESAARERGIRFLGCFDCQGRLDPAISPIAQELQGVDDVEWARRVADAEAHPNDADLARARTFATKVAAAV